MSVKRQPEVQKCFKKGRVFCFCSVPRIISGSAFPTNRIDGGCYVKSLLSISKWFSSEPSEKGRATIITDSIASEETVADELRFSKATQLLKWRACTRISVFSFLVHCSFHHVTLIPYLFGKFRYVLIKRKMFYLIWNQKIFSPCTTEIIWKSFYSHCPLEGSLLSANESCMQCYSQVSLIDLWRKMY